MKNTALKPHLLILVATTLVAGSFIASENLAGVINPFSLTLIRFIGAALILLPLILYKKKFRVKVFSTMPRAMIIGFFYSAFFIGLFESLDTTTALNTGTLYTLVPLGTALLSFIILKEKINNKVIMAYMVGVAGTVWVVFQGNLYALLSFSLNTGDYIFLLAALSMCCYSVSMKYLYRDDEMVVLVFCTLLAGSLWISIALYLFNQPLQWERISGNDFLNIGYLIIGATLSTMYLYQKTTILLGPSRVNAYIYLNPVLISIISFIIYGEPPKSIIILGVLLSVSSTIILQALYSVKKPNKLRKRVLAKLSS